MQRLLLLSRKTVAAVLISAGCGGSDVAAVATADVFTADTAATNDATPATDDLLVGSTTPDVGPTSWTVPTFELGTNEQGKATPKDFVPLLTGDALPVVVGPQGLSMVVLAFRTCGLYEPPLLLRARIATEDDAASGALDIARQKLNPAPDGLSYYYNFWLVVENPENAGGKFADIVLDVEDAKGITGTHSLRVALTAP